MKAQRARGAHRIVCSVIVLILWFYLSALSVLIGAAVNAELAPPVTAGTSP